MFRVFLTTGSQDDPVFSSSGFVQRSPGNRAKSRSVSPLGGDPSQVRVGHQGAIRLPAPVDKRTGKEEAWGETERFECS